MLAFKTEEFEFCGAPLVPGLDGRFCGALAGRAELVAICCVGTELGFALLTLVRTVLVV